MDAPSSPLPSDDPAGPEADPPHEKNDASDCGNEADKKDTEKQDATKTDGGKETPADDELPIPRWLFSMIGHVMAALLGLALGYLVLHRLRPGKFPLPDGFPWLW